MNKMKGALIVIDGVDGSGKTTQVNLLSQYLKEKNIDFEVISFPQYGKNEWAKKITDYLNGKLGKIDQVDPYKVAKFYAEDRLTVKDIINSWLSSGKIVLANRYVSSSKAHLGANLNESKRKKFWDWLEQLEYGTNSMPREDLTILLKVDPKVGQDNVQGKHKAGDLHESDLNHLIEANEIYLQLAKQNADWVVVDCMDDGEMKEEQAIHSEIVEILRHML